MSLARRHREYHAALAIAAASGEEGGQAQPAPAPVAEPRPGVVRDHIARFAAVAAAQAGTEPPAGDPPAATGTAEAQIALRLVSDLRTLHDIKSIERKIAHKRELLPAYSAWIEGVLAAAADGLGVPSGVSAEVLPTIMIWRIDVGDYAGAVPLIELVLEHGVALPARYNRDAATLVVEELAEAALRAQGAGGHFDLDLLFHIEALTDGVDMHDEARAKLEKAIGCELLALAETLVPGDPEFAPAHARALEKLRQAHGHHDRVGVKDRIKRAEKAIAAIAGSDDQDSGGSAA